MPDLQDFSITLKPNGFTVTGRIALSDASGKTMPSKDGKGDHDYRPTVLNFPGCWAVLTPEQQQRIADSIGPDLLFMVREQVDASTDGGVAVKAKVKAAV